MRLFIPVRCPVKLVAQNSRLAIQGRETSRQSSSYRLSGGINIITRRPQIKSGMLLVEQGMGIDDFKNIFQLCITGLCPVHDIANHLTAAKRNPNTTTDTNLICQTGRDCVVENFIKRRNNCYFCDSCR